MSTGSNGDLSEMQPENPRLGEHPITKNQEERPIPEEEQPPKKKQKAEDAKKEAANMIQHHFGGWNRVDLYIVAIEGKTLHERLVDEIKEARGARSRGMGR
jgi:hypothetical protein